MNHRAELLLELLAGQYKNKQIQVTDSGYNAAIKRWREAATDRGK
jgi:hypothetical protein